MPNDPIRQPTPAAPSTRKTTYIITAVVGLAVFGCVGVSCVSVVAFTFMRPGSQKDNRAVGDLIEHFKKSGLDGNRSLKIASLIGAKEGAGYSGPNFAIEVYVFDDRSKAESLERTGLNGNQCHRNGNFIMLATRGEDVVLPAFRSF